jgi:hypothetical protein
MSATEATPVEALRARLSEVQAGLAGARALADARARELQHDPTAERQRARNEASDRAELLDLTIEKLRRDLVVEEQRAREAAISEALTSEGPIQDRVRQADDAVWLTLAAHEQALAAKLAGRTELQRLNAKLYQLGYGGGDGEHERQVCVRPRVGEYERRVAKLRDIYAKCAAPLPMLPVVMS